MKFNVNFSAAGDDINLTLWLDVYSSDAYQPLVLARFDRRPTSIETANI